MQRKLEQIERITRSPQLQNSESLRQLFRYLAQHSLKGSDSPMSEQKLAIEVFARPATFDPRVDSTVRVSTSRLRSKLSEYYTGPGADDPILIEIPKGGYEAVFQDRVLNRVPNAAPSARRFPGRWIALAAVSVALLAAIGFVVSKSRASKIQVQATGAFWEQFTDGAEPTLVLFDSAASVHGNSPGRTDEQNIGVGEVRAVYKFGMLFERLKRKVIVQHARLLDPDGAKGRDLVVLGAPYGVSSLDGLPAQQEFVLRRVEPGNARAGELAIVNLRPRVGERQSYLASPGPLLTEDYALVEALPGRSPGHFVLLLAGTTTFGTQAAVDFVCTEANIQDLLYRLNGDRSWKVSPFAAVIRVKISGGTPVESKLIALHALAK